MFLVLGESVAVIDAGLPGRSGEVIAAVERLGRSPREITTIAITHHHVDHVGALADLQQRTGGAVCTSESEAAIVRGDSPAPRLAARSRGWSVLAVAERIGPTQSKPATISQVLADGDVIATAGLRAVLTPGHTVGHVSYVHQASGTLFVGDAAALSPRKHLTLPVGDHDEDPAATIASIERMAGFDFETACFGHGGTITHNAGVRMVEFSEKLANRVH